MPEPEPRPPHPSSAHTHTHTPTKREDMGSKHLISSVFIRQTLRISKRESRLLSSLDAYSRGHALIFVIPRPLVPPRATPFAFVIEVATCRWWRTSAPSDQRYLWSAKGPLGPRRSWETIAAERTQTGLPRPAASSSPESSDRKRACQRRRERGILPLLLRNSSDSGNSSTLLLS